MQTYQFNLPSVHVEVLGQVAQYEKVSPDRALSKRSKKDALPA